MGKTRPDLDVDAVVARTVYLLRAVPFSSRSLLFLPAIQQHPPLFYLTFSLLSRSQIMGANISKAVGMSSLFRVFSISFDRMECCSQALFKQGDEAVNVGVGCSGEDECVLLSSVHHRRMLTC